MSAMPYDALTGAPGDEAAPGDGYADLRASRLDWSEFWSASESTEWLVPRILIRGAAHLIAAGAGVGKSDLMMFVAAALATGRPVLGRPAGDPVRVAYVDAEQPLSVIRDRLVDQGYSEADDLSSLHYLHLPELVVDVPEGARALGEYVEIHNIEMVVLDTIGALTAGGENDADTARMVARFITGPLVSAGVTFVRLDHRSHKSEATVGAMGSSAKRRDVDVEWTLSQQDNGLKLVPAKDRRGLLGGQAVTLARLTEPSRYVAATTWLAGTVEVARILDSLGVELGASSTEALAALKAAGQGKRREVVLDALRYRRVEAEGTLHA